MAVNLTPSWRARDYLYSLGTSNLVPILGDGGSLAAQDERHERLEDGGGQAAEDPLQPAVHRARHSAAAAEAHAPGRVRLGGVGGRFEFAIASAS